VTTEIRRTPVPDTQTTSADYPVLRLALWSVAVYAGLGLLGFAVFAGFGHRPDKIWTPRRYLRTSGPTTPASRWEWS
jgi:hypothetical protein